MIPSVAIGLVATFAALSLITPTVLATFGPEYLGIVVTVAAIVMLARGLLVNPTRSDFSYEVPIMSTADIASVVIAVIVSAFWFVVIWLLAAVLIGYPGYNANGMAALILLSFWLTSWAVLLGRTLSLGAELREAIAFQLSPGLWTLQTDKRRISRLLRYGSYLFGLPRSLRAAPPEATTRLLLELSLVEALYLQRLQHVPVRFWSRVLHFLSALGSREAWQVKARAIGKAGELLVIGLLIYLGTQLSLGSVPEVTSMRDPWLFALGGAIAGACLAYLIGGVIRSGLTELSKAMSGAREIYAPIFTFVVGYFALVFLFASWFAVIERRDPTAFCGHSALVTVGVDGKLPLPERNATDLAVFGCSASSNLLLGDYLFLSISTFSTAGYGWNTVTPVSTAAQAAVALEPVIGYLWAGVAFALLLARLTTRGSETEVALREKSDALSAGNHLAYDPPDPKHFGSSVTWV